MKRQLLILLLIFTAISCKNPNSSNVVINKDGQAEKRFESPSFNFNYPEDWDITDSEEIEEGILYVAAEKNGFDSSGLVTVVAFDELIDMDELVMMNIAELQGNVVIGDLEFDPIADSKFNNMDSRVSHYKFSTLGIKHQGLVQAFIDNNNSYVLLMQGAIEDEDENVEGFTIIENSFQTKLSKGTKKTPASSTQ